MIFQYFIYCIHFNTHFEVLFIFWVIGSVNTEVVLIFPYLMICPALWWRNVCTVLWHTLTGFITSLNLFIWTLKKKHKKAPEPTILHCCCFHCSGFTRVTFSVCVPPPSLPRFFHSDEIWRQSQETAGRWISGKGFLFSFFTSAFPSLSVQRN